MNDKSIDPQSRAIIRYALEVNDPWLARLVRRADAGEAIGDTFDFEETPDTVEDIGNERKLQALTEIICRSGDEPETKAAALLVLMDTVENSSYPKVLANAAKHVAFTRCGDVNLSVMVDAQVAIVESELLASDATMS